MVERVKVKSLRENKFKMKKVISSCRVSRTLTETKKTCHSDYSMGVTKEENTNKTLSPGKNRNLPWQGPHPDPLPGVPVHRSS